ncbi:MAG: hypothetical protein WBK99_08655, partial [Solirubrobacterales bacterium]
MDTATQPSADISPVKHERLERCRSCAATVAAGQRYCLECGEPTAAATERLEWLDRVHVTPLAGDAATPTGQSAAIAGPQRPAGVQRLIDEQDQHPRPESKYAIFGAAGATAILLTALAAGAVGAGLA